MDKFTENTLRFAKILVDSGGVATAGNDKNTFHSELEKLAREQRTAGETTEQAYTRLATTTDAGRLLFKAIRLAPAPRQAAQDFVPRKKPEPLGPAARELEELAAAMGRGEKMPNEKAKAKILASNDPEHAALTRRVLAEEQAATAEVKQQRWSMPA